MAVNDVAPMAQIEAVVAEIHARGGRAFRGTCADVADEAAVLAMFERVLAGLGGLDILVNNAGILIEKPLLETTAADFDRLIGVNLRGAFLVGREALRVMARAARVASSTSPPSSPISAARTARRIAHRRAAC